MQHVYDLCKSKTVCEGGDTIDKKFDPAGLDNVEETKVRVCVFDRVHVYVCVHVHVYTWRVCVHVCVCLYHVCVYVICMRYINVVGQIFLC